MRLIIIDGLDAAGKDTHAGIMKRKREQRGERVLIRSHPEDDNRFGIIAKQALFGTGKKQDQGIRILCFGRDTLAATVLQE